MATLIIGCSKEFQRLTNVAIKGLAVVKSNLDNSVSRTRTNYGDRQVLLSTVLPRCGIQYQLNCVWTCLSQTAENISDDISCNAWSTIVDMAHLLHIIPYSNLCPISDIKNNNNANYGGIKYTPATDNTDFALQWSQYLLLQLYFQHTNVTVHSHIHTTCRIYICANASPLTTL